MSSKRFNIGSLNSNPRPKKKQRPNPETRRKNRVERLSNKLSQIKILPKSLSFFMPNHICFFIADFVEFRMLKVNAGKSFRISHSMIFVNSKSSEIFFLNNFAIAKFPEKQCFFFNFFQNLPNNPLQPCQVLCAYTPEKNHSRKVSKRYCLL